MLRMTHYARFAALLLLLLGVFPVFAQDAPNYVINPIGATVADDTVNVRFGVTNIGGTATATTTVELVAIDVNAQTIVASTTLRPLAGNSDRETITLTVPVTRFPPGAVQQFRIQIQDPAVNSPSAPISASIPVYAVPTVPTLNLDVLSNREQIALLVALIVVVTIILWLMTVLFRLLFRRPPHFGTWQPPYATLPPLDPNSTYGRRQLWQQHAQNNIITAPCTPNALHATKNLIGTDGRYLSGWRILALRMTQYDMYGRVSRSQVLASRRMIGRLNRAARKSGKLERRRVERMMRPVARGLARQARKRITPRSAMLPIALDVRFQGVHGEVNIVFQIYQCVNGAWQPLEGWQPDMMVSGKTIYESYTYTVFGQSGGESLRDFRRRLPDDLTQVLTELIGVAHPPPQPTERESPATNPNMQPVTPETDGG